MKLFIKLVIFLIILTMAGPYLLFGPSAMGKLLAFKELALARIPWSLPTLPKPGPATNKTDAEPWIQWSTANSLLSGPDQLSREQLAHLDIQVQDNIYYRWQDASGVWQFSQQPNRNTLNIVVRTDPNANVLQGLSTEAIDRAFGRVAAGSNSNTIVENNPFAKGEAVESTLPLPTTVPVSDIPKLIEQAKDVQKVLNERVKNWDTTI